MGEVVTLPHAKREKKERKKMQMAVAAAVLVFFLLAGVQVYRIWRTSNLNIVRVSEGQVEESLAVKALILRDEMVVTAPVAGEIEPMVPAGERVRKGGVVARIKTPGTGTVNVYAPEAGVVSYTLDGWENLLPAPQFDKIDVNKVLNRERNVTRVEKGKVVQKGQTIFRLVNNLERSYLYVPLKKEEAVRLPKEAGALVKVKFKDGTPDYYFRVEKIVPAEGGSGMFLSSNIFIPAHLDQRWLSVRLVTSSCRGMIVPATALVEKNGKTGVYVLFKQRTRWHQVEVVGKVGDKAAVRGLEEGTPVVGNGQAVREGEVVNF